VVVGAKNSTIYVHCSKKINDGGITSLKYHLNGVKRQVESCKKFPLGVKWKMKQLVEDLITKKKRKEKDFELILKILNHFPIMKSKSLK
jgi:hypothetical protein